MSLESLPTSAQRDGSMPSFLGQEPGQLTLVVPIARVSGFLGASSPHLEAVCPLKLTWVDIVDLLDQWGTTKYFHSFIQQTLIFCSFVNLWIGDSTYRFGFLEQASQEINECLQPSKFQASVGGCLLSGSKVLHPCLLELGVLGQQTQGVPRGHLSQREGCSGWEL